MSTYNLLNGYTGSKAPFVSKIKAFFDPMCVKYVEPYCGGAAIYFSNYNGRYEKELINDANINIMALYEVLANNNTRNSALQALLKIDKPNDIQIAQKQFEQAKQKLRKFDSWKHYHHFAEKDKIDMAVNTYITYTQSFNCGGNNYSAYKSNDKYRFEARRNILNAVERLRTEPDILCTDGLKIIRLMKEKPEVQMFIDWPYVGMYRSSVKLYHKEMPSLDSHIKGARALIDSRAAVVMCGYRSGEEIIPTIYDAILTGSEWHCFKIADTKKYCMFVKKGEKRKDAEEYIWTNRVPENAGLYISLHDYKEIINMKEYWDRIRNAEKMNILTRYEILEYAKAYREFEGGNLFY